jgi:conflict system STAND superfamily ATPase
VALRRPTDQREGPFTALAAALIQSAADLPKEEEGRGPALPEIAEGDSKTPAELARLLTHSDVQVAVKPILNALERVGAQDQYRERQQNVQRCNLVLLIDQLDEIFAPSMDPAVRESFVVLLAAFVATGRVWVVTTLRADLYEPLLREPRLKELKEKGVSFDLAAPGPVETAEIVRRPAEAAGLVYEKNVTKGNLLMSGCCARLTGPTCYLWCSSP